MRCTKHVLPADVELSHRKKETDPDKKAELQKQIDGIKNDRAPHDNHYHIQLGRTNAPKTTPKPTP
jgi:hypothetical protein